MSINHFELLSRLVVLTVVLAGVKLEREEDCQVQRDN